MAANLALSDVAMTRPDGTVIEHAHLLVRDGNLRVRAEGVPDVSLMGVESVERTGVRDQYRITLDSGVWVATGRGCGCS